MTKDAYYNHLNKQRYRCQVVEETETMVKVRLPDETARELRLDTELWLPKSHVTFEETY
jgi:hypothetical protein